MSSLGRAKKIIEHNLGMKAVDKTKIHLLAAWTIPVAVVVFCLKYLAFSLTGSVELYSDALESIVNIVAALAAFVAIRIAMKPADHNHPFGHYKAEYFAAILEGALVIVAALLIFWEAGPKLITPPHMTISHYGLIFSLAATCLNALWALILLRWGRLYRSPALRADGVHLLSDVVTSFGVVMGVIAAYVSGFVLLDPLLALLVAAYILWQGTKVINSSVQGLMDVGVDMSERLRIRDIITAHASGAIEAHDLRTRVSGRLIFVEFHLVVPATMSVGAAHAICDRIEAALAQELPHGRVVIHIEPEEEAKLPLGTTSIPFA